MVVLKNSSRSRRSKKAAAVPASSGAIFDVLALGVALAVLAAAALRWCASAGYILYFGDGVSHLNTARRIVDSRTPGIDQFGSPWLPLPHLLMIPFVSNDAWWKNGLAGGIPAAICLVIAGLFLYGSARIAFGSRTAGFTAAALFAFNPNVLYMSTIPMTESALFASVTGVLFCTLWFGRTQSWMALVCAGLFSNAASLSRYEGWFLIPFAALYVLLMGGEKRWWATIVFSAIASIGPLGWFFYNWYLSGNALEFYNGPYSALAIYQRSLKAGMARYAGDHDWAKAILYYVTAGRLCAGWGLVGVGVAGLLAAFVKRAFWPVLLLVLPCVFYVMGMYSSGNPIFVPELWPNSYYNTRYGLAVVPLLAIGGAAIVSLLPAGWRGIGAAVLVVVAVAPWLVYPRADNWITWKESEVNSVSRRAWTAQAAEFLRANYRSGDGIFTSLGDLSGIYEEAGIPLREVLHDGNNPAWLGAATRPNLMLHEEWAVGLAGDSVVTAIQQGNRKHERYHLVRWISVPGAPVVEIYRRQ